MIAGAGLPSGEFHEFSDDEFGASNLFDFSNSPDTLQTLDAIGSNDQKLFANPQELTAGPLPDSPAGSYHDSSSESASSTKRTGSSDSSKTPAATTETTMDDGPDMKMDWGDAAFTGFHEDDGTFTFGREADSSGMDGMYGFGEPDDSFMDRSFDFESASSSPEAQAIGQTNVVSPPAMPASKNVKSHKAANKKSQPGNHKKQNSVRRSSCHIFCFVTHKPMALSFLICPYSNTQPHPWA